ncbi:MAG: site-specific integrase [Clostridia bacterium]|nr:site-specific integrase [Clostridia bacterium]
MEKEVVSSDSKYLISCFTNEKLKLEKTRKDYTREILKFSEFIEKDILIATADDCKSYINMLKEKAQRKKISVYTVEKIYIYLFSFFNYIVSVKGLYDFIPGDFTNCFKRVKKPAAPRSISSDKIITLSELDQLISILKEGTLRDYVALMLIFISGPTLSQTVNLKWNQLIEDASGNIAIEIPLKNYEKRYIKLSKDMAELLAEYKMSSGPVSKDSHVFLSKFHKPISGRWLRKVLRAACEKANFEYIYTPRDLRHSAVTLCLINGAPPEKVKEQFGWSDIRFADRYNYSMPVLEDNAIDYVNFKFK